MSFSRSLNKFIRRAASDKRGNVAVIFAFVLIPLLGLVGAAVDYTRANAARTALQTALDSTALMISKDIASIPQSQIQSRAQQYFNALYTNTSAPIPSIQVTYTPNSGSGSTVVVTGNGSMQTDFLKVLGSSLNQLQIGASSTTTWGQTKLRVALVLDNTGSMSASGKIGALRTAATNLVNTLSATATSPGDVMFSLVPFMKDVNMGSSNYSASWIDWTDWQNPPTQQSAWSYSLPTNWSFVGPGTPCPFGSSPYNFGCLSASPNSSSSASSIPTNGKICPGPDSKLHKFYNGCWDSVQNGTSTCTGKNCSCSTGTVCSCTGSGSSKTCTTNTYSHTWTSNAKSTWTGCFSDRTQDYDTTSTTPSSGNVATLFPADQLYENSEPYCATNNSPPLQPIMPMTSDFATMKTNIAAMQPTGGTNQSVGLAWGWMSLLQTAPLNAPAEDSNYVYNRIIILLSDGLNTENRWPSYGDGNTQSFACGSSTYGCIDLRQKALCDNIKSVKDPKTGKAMYTIYTIQVNTGGDPTSTILQYCASDSSKFAMLTTSSQIISTFNNIGAQLSALRISQ